MTLKVEFLQFLKGQKKLEEVSIQNWKLLHELLGNYLSKSAWLSKIQHIPGHAIDCAANSLFESNEFL